MKYILWALVAVLFSAGVAFADPPVPQFRRGDANNDSAVDVSDASFILNYLFNGTVTPQCLDACDADDDGGIFVCDAIVITNWLFLGGFEPPAPGPRECGPDPTPDNLTCDNSVCQ